MASVLPVLLFCLLLQCTPAYSQSPCMIPNGVASDLFSLIVDSTDYMPNKIYNVTISGIEVLVEVALSAVVDGSSFGTWMDNSADCSGILENRTVTKTNKWTSPANMSANVTISAYVSTADGTFLSTTFISSEPNTSTASPATSEPSTASTASMASTAPSEPSTASTASMASTAPSEPSTASTASMASTASSEPSTASTASMASTAPPEPSTASTASMASTAPSEPSTASTASMASTATSQPSTASTGSKASTAAANPSTASTGSMTNTAASSTSSTKMNSGAATVANNGPTSKETTMNKSTNPITTPTGNAMSTFKTSSGFVITLILFALIALQQSQ